jgi:hypothetical protein
MKGISDPYIQWFRHEETGEDTWFDPRLTAVALRAKGVNVQRFKTYLNRLNDPSGLSTCFSEKVYAPNHRACALSLRLSGTATYK